MMLTTFPSDMILPHMSLKMSNKENNKPTPYTTTRSKSVNSQFFRYLILVQTQKY